MSQKLGLRNAAVLSGLVYTVGCVASAASDGVGAFLIGRTLQGAGAGWIVGFCYVAIEATFPERLWVRLFAAAAGAWGIASVVGPLVGGFFADGRSWRGAFWMFAGQGVIFAILSAILLGARKPPAKPASRLAWRTLGTLTISVGLVAAANA